jgi:receptor-binding and translocation channel-forming TcA subunit of Tc toxin
MAVRYNSSILTWYCANWTVIVASVIRIGADALNFESTSAGRKNQHMRTNQERTQTANTTGYELKNIDKQIAASNVRITMANQDITNQQKQIDNAQEVLDFLANKYTNVQLYSFMEGRVRTLYYQIYQMAYNWARKAEMCFQFERGVKDTNFIQPGYWEPGHDGLLSGEALFMSLKAMEAAYHDDRGHDFEVTKFVSLRQTNPLALIQFRETGTCEFAVPEILYDMDFPGHYLRKIKAVTLTIPCIIGPYTTVNCTLRLTAHKYRSSPTAKDAKDYVEKTPDQGGDAVNGDPRFDTVLIPISAAAVSSANSDAGVFDLSFSNSERYLPFEGAGAISQWSLSLPSGFRQFDYGTIQDVVVQIKYTSRDGDDKLATAASGAVTNYIKTVADLPNGLFAVVDARSEFATQWAAFQRAPAPPPAAQQRVLVLSSINERLPMYTKGWPVSGLVAQNIWVVTDAQVAASAWSLTVGNNSSNSVAFTDGPAVGELKVFVAQGPVVISDWTLTLMDASTVVRKVWVLMRYVMK